MRVPRAGDRVLAIANFSLRDTATKPCETINEVRKGRERNAPEWGRTSLSSFPAPRIYFVRQIKFRGCRVARCASELVADENYRTTMSVRSLPSPPE